MPPLVFNLRTAILHADIVEPFRRLLNPTVREVLFGFGDCAGRLNQST